MAAPRNYLDIPPYKTHAAPVDADSLIRYLTQQLQALQRTVEALSKGVGTTTDRPPIAPMIGEKRYATGAWATTLGAEGLYIFKSSGWTKIV